MAKSIIRLALQLNKTIVLTTKMKVSYLMHAVPIFLSNRFILY